MRFLGLAQRNLREILRERFYMITLLVMPPVLIAFSNVVFRGFAVNGDPDPMLLGMPTVGIGVLGLLWLMVVTAAKIAGDKETGFLRRLRTTPTGALGFVLAYSIPPVVVSIFQILLILGVALLLGLTWQENTYLVLPVFFLCGLSSIGLGMILASFTNNRDQIEGTAILIMTILFPLTILSLGAPFMPVEVLPPWASAIGSTAYTTQAIKAGASVLLDNAGLEIIIPELRNLGIWAGSLFLLGVLCFRRNI